MKATYYKFSDERNRTYSVSTRFQDVEGARKVIKAPVYPEGKVHMEHILSYQDALKAAYPKVTICPVEEVDGELHFDFIKGKGLSGLYEDCALREDKAEYERLLQLHKQIVLGAEDNTCAFVESELTRTWFGPLREYVGKPALKVANYDAIAGNIIMQGEQPVFIDYEWVFLEPIPRDLVLYHCIRDEYLHNERLEAFYPLEDALLAIGVVDRPQIMEQAYHNFFNHVISERDGRSFALGKLSCLKAEHEAQDNRLDDERRQHLEHEKNVMEQELTHVKREWDKCALYWKQSLEENYKLKENNQTLVNIREERAAYESMKSQQEAEKFQLIKIVEDKDTHIHNVEAQLAQVTMNYQTLSSHLIVRVLRKIKHLFK